MGLGTLIRLYLAAKSPGSTIKPMHLGKQLQHILCITNLLNIFKVIAESGIKLM